MAIVQTEFKLPQAVISNGLTTGNGFSNPNNLLLVDNETADSNLAQASDVIVGNFNFNIPEGSVITGIEMKVLGYSGAPTSPSITLTPYAVDNTGGSNLYYPYITPLSSFTTSMATYDLGTSTYLFNTTWTVDQINNFKLQLVANGTLFIDAVLVSVLYYETEEVVEEDASDSCIDCQSQIQAQPFSLALPVLATDTSIYLKSFNLPDGTPINVSMLGSCGGDIDIVMDQGRPKGNGQPFEENAKVINITPQANGTVKLDFATLTNRGLMFTTPYTHSASLVSEHNANGEVVISNSAPFYNKFLKKCHIGILVSPPIYVEDEGVIVNPVALEKLNFTGGGVVATEDAIDDAKVNVYIAGTGVAGVGHATSGAAQVASLTFDLNSDGVDRLCLVQISTEQVRTVTGVTYNGFPLTQKIVKTDAGNNLRSEIWSLVNPPTGLHSVVVSLSGAAYISAGGEILSGVDQAIPTGATQSANGSSTTPLLSITPTYGQSIIVDGLGTASGATITYSPTAPQVLNWKDVVLPVVRQGGSSFQNLGSIPAATPMSYTLGTSTPWVYTAIEVHRVSSVISSGVASVTGQQVDNTDPVNPVVLGKVDVTGADTTADYLQQKVTIGSSDSSVTVTPSVVNPGGNEVLHFDITGAGGGGGGGGGNVLIDQTPDNGSYGLLGGAVNGINTQYTVSSGIYLTGTLVVYRNGLVQLQGAADDWEETVPGSGTFDFNTAPATGDILTVEYQTAAGSGGTTVQTTITQTAHGFAIGDVITSNGTDGKFGLSQGDVPANAEVAGIVSSVIDANNFVLVTEGFLNLTAFAGNISGAVARDILFLDDLVAGGLTLTAPTAPPTVNKPLAQVIDASTFLIYFHNYRGQNNQTIPAIGATIVGVSTNPGTGVQTITHGLGSTPTEIELVAFGNGIASASAAYYSSSTGWWTTGSGNVCVYAPVAAAGGAGAITPLTSIVFAISISQTSGGASAQATGIIQNVTNTTFDIAWTSGFAGAPFAWKVK